MPNDMTFSDFLPVSLAMPGSPALRLTDDERAYIEDAIALFSDMGTLAGLAGVVTLEGLIERAGA